MRTSAIKKLRKIIREEVRRSLKEEQESQVLITADYKDFDGFISQLFDQLPYLGLYIEEWELSQGTDQIGIIIGTQPIDQSEFY